MNAESSNSTSVMVVRCEGMSDARCEKIKPRAARAAEDLGLLDNFYELEICGDFLAEYEEAWFRLVGAAHPDENRCRLVMFCPDGVFAKRIPITSFDSIQAQIWDQAEAPIPVASSLEADFSESRSDQFLYHNLLLARDVVRKILKPDDVPDGMSEAFQAAWAVTVDGRLSQMGLPGYSLSARRGIFSRLFSSAGVLLPDHWQVFQALWDGALPTNNDVLAVVRQLPRL